MLLAATVRVDHQGFGMFLRQPDWRSWRGSAEGDLEVVFVGEVDCAIEPGEIESSLAWLHECPREFAQMDEFESELTDVREIARPLGVGPRLGIVVDAELHQLGGRKAELSSGAGRCQVRHGKVSQLNASAR